MQILKNPLDKFYFANNQKDICRTNFLTQKKPYISNILECFEVSTVQIVTFKQMHYVCRASKMSAKYEMQTILSLVPYSKKVQRKKKSSLHLATFKVKNTVIITSYINTKYVCPQIHFYLSIITHQSDCKVHFIYFR